MKAIGMMMVEHRLIERMVALLSRELEDERSKHVANPLFIHEAVDFFRSYADRTHHGKEEDILFRELEKKPLTEEDRKMLDDLIAEHTVARKNVKALLDATERYEKGEKAAMEKMISSLQKLVALYPAHIEKEDRHFFIPVMRYFSESEQAAMEKECEEFDRKMIHEKYSKVVEKYE